MKNKRQSEGVSFKANGLTIEVDNNGNLRCSEVDGKAASVRAQDIDRMASAIGGIRSVIKLEQARNAAQTALDKARKANGNKCWFSNRSHNIIVRRESVGVGCQWFTHCDVLKAHKLSLAVRARNKRK